MKLFEMAMNFLAWLAILWIVTLCWVGAEYVFEAAVHSSNVDSAIAGLLSYYILKTITRIDKEHATKRGMEV